jgi:hypothetical protein
MRPTVTALILANLIPLFGVLFAGWQVFDVVMVFWVENVIIGLINLLKMRYLDNTNLTAGRRYPLRLVKLWIWQFTAAVSAPSLCRFSPCTTAYSVWSTEHSWFPCSVMVKTSGAC